MTSGKPIQIVEIKFSKCFAQSKVGFFEKKQTQTLEPGKNILEDGCIMGYIQPSIDQEQAAQQALSWCWGEQQELYR